MIYSDRETQLALESGPLRITPRPAGENFSSTAVDLRLDFLLHIWNVIPSDPTVDSDPCFRPTADGFRVREEIAKHTTDHDLRVRPYRFPRGAFILGWTREKIRIPFASRLAARVEGKSSLARLGLGVHVTAPTIHAGFGDGADPEGDSLQLEIWNVGPLPIELCFEMKVCQLIIEEVHGTPMKGYRGQFRGQGPKPS